MSLIQIGGPATQIIATPNSLFATAPTDGGVWQYSGAGQTWTPIGPGGAMFAYTAQAVTGPDGKTRFETALFRLNADKQSVWMYKDSGPWQQVGGPAAAIYGGGDYLYATSPVSGDLNQYSPSNGWQFTGGPGKTFVQANGSTLFALTPAGDAVVQFDGIPPHDGSWKPVGGPAAALVGGGMYLYAMNENGNLHQYDGSQWNYVGGPLKGTFSASRTVVNTPRGPLFWEVLYGLDQTGQVWRYEASGTDWTPIGGAAAEIAASYTLFALSEGRDRVLMLE